MEWAARAAGACTSAWRKVLKTFQFGALEPDRPFSLFRAKNCWPSIDGYIPARDFTPLTPALALPGILGGCAYVSSVGEGRLLGGTDTTLYVYTGVAWSSKLGGLAASGWRFDQFGDLVIAANGGAPVKYDMISDTAALLGGSPPDSDMVATVRNQVFLAGDPAAQATLAISGYNDSEEWSAGTNQCLFVPFVDGGRIMGLAGGETGVILQQRSITRATYTGDVTVWQFDKISQNVGCMAKGSVASAGQMVFFLSEQGFMMTDRNTVTPIGAEKTDRTFFSTYNRSDIDNISCAVDPRSTVVSWLMPGAPGRLWSYNWTLQKWADFELPCKKVFSGFTANTTLEALDALFPGGLETVTPTLDDIAWQGGNPLLLLIDNSSFVGALAGPIAAAEFDIAPQEFITGRRVRIRRARVLTDATGGTVTVDARARAGDAATAVASGSIRDNGTVPLRANGRVIGLTVNMPTTSWTYAVGLEVEFEPEGRR